MNGSAKRMMAILAVFAMIASAMVVVFADEQDSSADANPYYEYYGSELVSDLSKNVYLGLKTIEDFSDSILVTYSDADKDKMAEMGKAEYLSSEIAKGIDALRFDHPEINYYFSEYSYREEVADVKVEIIPNGFDDTKFTGDKTAYDGRIATWAAATGITGDGFTLIKNIHNYVSSHLNYDDDGALDSASKARKGNCRSVYNAFDPAYEMKEDGKNLVVCEGYAKMFKVLCDYYGVPCLIVTGVAGTGGDGGNHMWNYVLYNEKCFLVDCTWDCNTGGDPYDNYLLAGSSKVISSVAVIDSHDPCGITDNYVFYRTFYLPTLSALSVNSDGSMEGGTQYLVTFKNGTETFRENYVIEGGIVSYPGEPTGPVGWNFLGWKEETAENYYDFSAPVTKDLVLIADSTMLPVYKIIYDSLGGSKVGNTIVLTTENTAKITNSVPFREGFNFLGWNTAKDGTGLEYKAGDEITLETDEVTLYAIWEDTSSVSYKIDSYVAKAAAFLSEEAIPGVSNMLLTIAVITTAVSLLAILAISRK